MYTDKKYMLAYIQAILPWDEDRCLHGFHIAQLHEDLCAHHNSMAARHCEDKLPRQLFPLSQSTRGQPLKIIPILDKTLTADNQTTSFPFLPIGQLGGH